MEQEIKTSSRKKFLFWGAAVLSSLTVLKYAGGNKPQKKETVKMLTQDGKLVEIDAEMLTAGKREKVDDEQLKNWVHKM